MSALLRQTPTPTAYDEADCVTILAGPDALDAIGKPSCAAAIWQRTPLPDFQSWIDGLAPDHLPEGRLVLRPEATCDAVHQLCEVAQMPNAPERDLLINDITALADLFCERMRASYLRLRLDRVTNNACSKFHKDAIRVRLVCTYRGTGTQFGVSKNGEEPRHISTVPTGSPMLMRGTLWPETPQSGLLHRSPPIEGTGETRFVLVLDPTSDP